MNGNVIQLTTVETMQFSVWWVNFPDPIGKNPAVVLSHDNWSDGITYTVATICSTTPDKGRRYEDLWIPICLAPGRVSYIRLNSIYSVNRNTFDRKIGYIPNDKRQLITERYIALLTGASVPRLCDIGDDDASTTPDNISNIPNSTPANVVDQSTPSSDTDTNTMVNTVGNGTGVITRETPSTPDADKPRNQVYTYTKYKYSVPLIRGYLYDPTYDVTKQSDLLLTVAKLFTKKLSDDTLVRCLVSLVRDYGFDHINNTTLFKNRFDSIVDELVNRGLLAHGNGLVLKKDGEFHKEFANPVK